MKVKKIIASIALTIGVSAYVNAAAPSILQVRDSLNRTPVIYPESFETDVHEMMKNWYLTNFADIDVQADSRSSVTPSDEELIERLAALPAEIELPFNSIVRAHIVAYTERRKQLVENMLGMSLYYMPIFEQALDKRGLPLELKYLPVIESALNPDAVSKAGATGLWQFMLATATGEGLEVSTLVDERRDPRASSEAAAGYLKKLYDIFGDWSLAIAAYNCGPGNVTKAIRRAGDGKKDFWQIYPYLPEETRGYVPAFIAANYVMNYYNKHNISPALARKPIVTDTVHVNKRINFEQIRDVLGIPIEELRALNPQYRKDLIPGDIKPYPLVLPTLQVYAFIAHEDSIAVMNAPKYGRRNVVEPAKYGTGSDEKGEYVEETVVKYHTVKRNETLASIANLYGVTQESIRKANKIGKRVTRGQRLKINTIERRYVNNDAPTDTAAVQVDTVAPVAPMPADSVAADSVAQPTASSDTVAAAASKPVEKPKQPKEQPKPKPQPQTQEKPVTHKVVKGESLFKISQKYGVTVDAIKKENNLKSDNIQPGQVLKIPKSAKSSASRKK